MESMSVNRKLDLDPLELSQAFCRRQAPLPLPKPVDFNLAKSIDALLASPWPDSELIERWHRGNKSTRRWSKAECHFWLLGVAALHKAENENDELGIQLTKKQSREFHRDVINKLFASTTLDGRLNKALVIELVNSVRLPQAVWPIHTPGVKAKVLPQDPLFALAYPILGLVSIIDFIEIWQTIWTTYQNPYMSGIGDLVQSRIITAIRRVVVPFITGVELQELRDYLALEMQRLRWIPHSSDAQIPLPYLVAGLFGMHNELLSLIERIPDGFYSSESVYPDRARPQLLVMGLSDPDLAIYHWQRLGLKITKPVDLTAWIALTEWRALGEVYNYLEDASKVWQFKADPEVVSSILNPLLKVKAPEAALYIAKLSLNTHYQTLCNQWLESNSQLIDSTECSSDRLPIQKACPEWLSKLFKQAKVGQKFTMPDYLAESNISTPVLDGYCLTVDETEQLFVCIKASAPDKLHPMLLALREKVDRRLFDKFVWEVFESWLGAGGPSKDKWCMLAVGYLGSDEAVCKLIPLMKDWRAHGNPGRAGFGLDCLMACGSDMALMKLHEISQSGNLKSLQYKAREIMTALSLKLGLTADQLEDRIVPQCGIDSSGSRVFEFGARQFCLVLGPDLIPYLKDMDGKVLADLPAPGKKDDAELAAQSVRGWKTTKNQIKTVVKTQTARFELAMISGRRWTKDQFQNLLLKHPILKQMCKSLIWGQFDGDDKLLKTFRYTQEGEFADEHDHVFLLGRECDVSGSDCCNADAAEGDAANSAAGESRVGIVHPLHLTESQLSAWRGIVTDYGLVPPFAQLGRTIYELNAKEVESNSINRFAGKLLEAVSIPGNLERRNWVREAVGDGLLFRRHYKYFPYKETIAFVVYPGIESGSLLASEPQELKEIGFYKGRVEVAGWYSRPDVTAVKLTDIDPVIMSEVLSDLTMLVSKSSTK